MCRLLPLLLSLLLTAPGLAQAQFTTSAEVKPILKMIKPQWVSLREYNGEDLLYFTLLEVYRCGIEQIRYVVNTGKPKVWQTPPCPSDSEDGQTFAEIPADRLPYTNFPLASVERLRIELTYDDGTVEWAEYDRAEVLQ